MKAIILFILSMFLILRTAGQHVVIPPYHNPYIIDYQPHNGYIVFNNEEKMNGIIQYAFWEFPTYNLKFFLPNGKFVKRYRFKGISYVALAGSDSTLSNKDSTYFRSLDKSHYLYRQLTFDDSLQVYDYFFNVDESNGLIREPIEVKENNQVIEFGSEGKFIKWMQANYPDKIKWNKDITAADIIRQLNKVTVR